MWWNNTYSDSFPLENLVMLRLLWLGVLINTTSFHLVLIHQNLKLIPLNLAQLVLEYRDEFWIYKSCICKKFSWFQYSAKFFWLNLAVRAKSSKYCNPTIQKKAESSNQRWFAENVNVEFRTFLFLHVFLVNPIHICDIYLCLDPKWSHGGDSQRRLISS